MDKRLSLNKCHCQESKPFTEAPLHAIKHALQRHQRALQSTMFIFLLTYSYYNLGMFGQRSAIKFFKDCLILQHDMFQMRHVGGGEGG